MLARNIICSRNYWSYRNVVLCVAIPAVLLTASGTLAHAQVLEDFKDRDRVREWKVVADPQVPGATGQLSSAEGVRDGSLRLDFDFNCEGGEGGRDRCDSRSIGVTKKLATAAPGEVLSLWVRCTACEIGLAVTDGSGQRLRYTPASLPLSARSLDAWRRVIVSLPRNVTGHAGGANDGKFHPGVQEIHVEGKKDRLLGSKGYLEVDEVGLYGSMAEASGGEVTIDLAKREFVPIAADEGTSASAARGVSIGGKSVASRVDAASRTGFRWVRRGVAWNVVEKTPGEFDFSSVDDDIAKLDALHLQAILVLSYGHPVYTGGPRTPPRADSSRRFPGT